MRASKLDARLPSVSAVHIPGGTACHVRVVTTGDANCPSSFDAIDESHHLNCQSSIRLSPLFEDHGQDLNTLLILKDIIVRHRVRSTRSDDFFYTSGYSCCICPTHAGEVEEMKVHSDHCSVRGRYDVGPLLRA